jgi:hypothetical protein
MAVATSGGRQRGARETSCRRRIEGMVDGGMGLATRERGRRRVQRKREGDGAINVEREGFSHQKLGHPCLETRLVSVAL